MNEVNPYQSPENSKSEPSKSPRSSFASRLVGGVFLGIAIACAFIVLIFFLNPPTFISDFIEHAIKILTIGVFIGLVVGAMWGGLSAASTVLNKRSQ